MSDESQDNGYRLLVEFTDDSPSYANGFRVGEVWGRMASGQYEITLPIEPDNHKVYKQVAGHFGYIWEITPTEMPEWFTATFTKSKPRLNLVK